MALLLQAVFVIQRADRVRCCCAPSHAELRYGDTNLVLATHGYTVNGHTITIKRTVDLRALAGLWSLAFRRFPEVKRCVPSAVPLADLARTLYTAIQYVDDVKEVVPAIYLFGVRVRCNKRRVLKLPFEVNNVIYYIDEFEELGELDEFNDLNPILQLWTL